MQNLIDKYRTYIENDLGWTPETVNKYITNLYRLFDKLKIYDISQVKATIINDRLIDDFWTDNEAGIVYSDSTRASYLSSLKSFLKFCFDINVIDCDISVKIKMPKKRELYLEGLSNQEQKKLREYLASNLKTEKDMRNAALIWFLWATACRISEALNARCHPDSFIYFHDERIRSGDFHVEENKVYVHILGKGKRDRVIIFPNGALKYLNNYLDNRKIKNDILFHNVKNAKSDSIKLLRQSVVRIVKDIFDECGIKTQQGIATHVLRHTAINTWIEKGIDSKQIITMTGHSQESGLDPYFKRNKKLTDVFGGKGKAVIDSDNKRTKELEELMYIKYTPKYIK